MADWLDGHRGITLGPNNLYMVYLDDGIDVGNIFKRSCGDFAAYHLFVTVGIITPKPAFYGVVPLKCAGSDLNLVTTFASHEIIEAATDPGGLSWTDKTKSLITGDIFTEGEAADIGSVVGDQPTPSGNIDGYWVAPYWSNADQTCVPIKRQLRLDADGVPPYTAGAYVNQGGFRPEPQLLPYTSDVWDGSRFSYHFISPVGNFGSADTRYATAEPDATIKISGDFSLTAHYSAQYQLTVTSTPVLAPNLTPSGWRPARSSVALTTDATVNVDATTRYRFSFWGEDASGTTPATSVFMDGPKTASAFYTKQELITFAQSGLPAGLPWSVSVNGVNQPGPYANWFDYPGNLTFTFGSPAPGATPGTRYVVVSTSQASGFSGFGNGGTVTAIYQMEHLMSITSTGLGNSSVSVFNGLTNLGLLTDSSPVSVWLAHGTALSLRAPSWTTASSGSLVFFQGFFPAPTASLDVPLDLQARYLAMPDLIVNALSSGGLAGPGATGLANSYAIQFATVQADLAARNDRQALSDLQIFIAHVTAQSGKSLAPPIAASWERDSLLVYHDTLCAALTLGQVDGPTASTDYQYYATNVGALGDVPLAPCG